jgi:hypothetical protein
MFRVFPLIVLTLLTLSLAVGCNQQTWQEKTYQVKLPNGVEQAKNLLQRYVDGQPLGSEVTSFPQIIEDAKKADPQKGELLQKGLQDLQQSPAGLAAKAKALLEKL